MAQRTVLVDDLDGGEAAETVVFALDGTAYEIDLNEDNAAQLRDDLASWVAHARSQGGPRRTRGRRSAAAKAPTADNATIRAWARDAGYAVSDRGRIPGEVVDAYHAAN